MARMKMQVMDEKGLNLMKDRVERLLAERGVQIDHPALCAALAEKYLRKPLKAAEVYVMSAAFCYNYGNNKILSLRGRETGAYFLCRCGPATVARTKAKGCHWIFPGRLAIRMKGSQETCL